VKANRHLRAFKAIAAQIAHRHGFAFGVFLRDHGLQDFLVDEVTPSDGVAEIAAKALHYFCVEEDRFNGFFIGVETAVQFLNEHLGRPATEAQRAIAFRDLKNILDGGGQLAALEQWAKAHY
jgi:hypothetical protein